MYNAQEQTTLAHRIGLCRIALVVDQFYNQVQAQPDLQEPFRVVGNWGDNKSRLTYFWWVTLGGNKNREVSLDLIPMDASAGFDADLLRDWVALFRQVVFSVVKGNLADAWMERVSRLSRTLLASNNHFHAKQSNAA